jgi:hypothetical protein
MYSRVAVLMLQKPSVIKLIDITWGKEEQIICKSTACSVTILTGLKSPVSDLAKSQRAARAVQTTTTPGCREEETVD